MNLKELNYIVTIADEGSITLGGEDITFAPEYQRSRVIGHLFQDPLKGTAPNMTIEENLALAYLRAGTAPHAIFSRISRKDKELFREKLSLLDMGLEDRMKQPVGLLSGGQRQRLAMARALLHDTPIYLFDEATSNVDAESENDIIAAIRSLAGRKTVILISHRLANVVDSDCIYVLDKGRIAERGTHAELLKKQGAYSRLYTAQKQLETLETEDA